MKSEIVIGTDLMESSHDALDVGTYWAAFLNARPVVLHVHPSNFENSSAYLSDPDLEKKFIDLSDSIRKALQEELDKQVKPYDIPGLNLITKIRYGDRAKAFIKRSVEKESKLIVLGWDESLIKGTMWMASTVDKVIRASFSPVLVAKNTRAKRPKKILFPFILNKEFVDALGWIQVIVSEFQSMVCFLHVYDGEIQNENESGPELIKSLYPDEERILSNLKKFIDDVPRMGGSFELKILGSDSPEELVLKEISDFNPDLTVVAMRRKTGIQKLFLGSMTEKILKHSDSSVLVLKEIE